MAFIHLLSKFTDEAMAVELFLMGTLGLSLFGFYLFKRRRYGVAGKQIPDHVVKAFLFEILSLSEGFKRQLFGQAPLEGGLATSDALASAAARAAAAGAGLQTGDASALKAQIGGLTVKNDELSKLVSALTADKKALEDKLKAGGGSAPAAGDDSELKSKIANLEARLAEYEVIEDDLANLKRYQQENKQLKATIDMMKGGGASPAPAAVAAPVVAAAPAPSPAEVPQAPPPPVVAAPSPATPPVVASPIVAAEAARSTAEDEGKLNELASKVDESIAVPATDGVKDPALLAAAQTAPAASDTAQDKPAAAAEQKSDSDLLSEFEKMLSG